MTFRMKEIIPLKQQRLRYRLVIWLMHRFNTYERMKLYLDWKRYHHQCMNCFGDKE